MRSPVATLFVLGVTLLPASTRAQEAPDEIVRRELIADAERARDAGDHTRALDLATRAGRLRMTPSLRQLIAYEHGALGHALAAFDAAGRCVREAEVDGALRHREVILAACRELVESLRARVGRVMLRVPEGVTGARVTVQSDEVPAALWGVPYPVQPGSVRVEATRADGATFARTVTVDGGDQVEVAVTWTAPPPRHVPPGPRVAPWIVAGAGALAAAAGVALVVAGDVARGDRDAECDVNGVGRCGPVALNYDDRYRALTTAGQVAIGVGAAAVAGGVLWYLLARARSSEASGPHLGVNVATSGAQLVLGGSL